MNDPSRLAKKVGRPSLDKAAQIERRILDAATSIFMRHGSRATMNEIIYASELSRKTVYARYPNKQMLLVAVLRNLFDPNVASRLSFVTCDSIEKTLQNVIRECIKEATTPESVALRSLIKADPEAVREVMPTIMSGLERRYVEPLQYWLSEQRQHGKIRNVDTYALASLITKAALEEASRMADLSATVGQSTFAEFLADLVANGLKS